MTAKNTKERVIGLIASSPGFYNNYGPYMTTSHCLTPIYPDIRTSFTDPKRLKLLATEIIKLIKKSHVKFDLIIGGATAGMPLAVVIASMLNKPFCYVRSKKKSGGRNVAVEGYLKKGQTAILIDDVAAHGQSKTKFVKNIRQTGIKVRHIFLLLTRNKANKKDQSWIKKSKVVVHDFGNINEVQKYALKHNIISKEAYNLLYWFYKEPHTWHKDKKKWQYFLKYQKNRKFIKSHSGV